MCGGVYVVYGVGICIDVCGVVCVIECWVLLCGVHPNENLSAVCFV